MAIIDLAASMFRRYRFRGKLRLLGRFTPKQGERSALIFGYRVKLDLSDDMQRWIFLGAFEPEETSVVRSRLKPGMVFVDVGANIGYFSLLAASRVGKTGRVFAFEPSVWASGRLAETVKENRIEQIRVEPIGLSECAGELNLHVPPASFRNHTPSMIAWSDPSWRIEKVQVRTLDDCLHEWGVEHVDLMKVDVEGHEPAMFRGAEKSLASGRIRAILVEFNDEALKAAGSSASRLHADLIAAGFRDELGDSLGPDPILVNRLLIYSGRT